MRGLLAALIVVSVLLSVWFVVRLRWPGRSDRPATAWLLTSWTLVTTALEVLLLLVVLGIGFPVWMAVLALVARDAVWVWRLVVLEQARREDAEIVNKGVGP